MSDDEFMDEDSFISEDSFEDSYEKPKASKPAKKAAVSKPAKKSSSKSSALDSSEDVAPAPRKAPSTSTASNEGGSKSIEQTYTKMEQHEHILLRPDMYIGSTRRITEELWVWDDSSKCMVSRSVTYSPGLYKIFDEVLVNAADNFQRDPKMRFIKVIISQDEGLISVHNDGDGIPIEKHKVHNKYVPELIFGDLLTGSNFDDSQAKVTGGRNGLGAKLANIYSNEFIVETSCNGKQFKQVFRQNMHKRDAAVVTAAKGKDFTKISFKPDLKRFDNMESLDDDIVALFKKRVYDVAGCNSKLNVWLNGEQILIKSFKDYVSLYFKNRPEESKPEIIGPEIVMDDEGKKRWEVAFTVSNGDFQQVSFVNSIWTIRGGNHVQSVVKKISDQLQPKIKRKNKGTDVKPAMIRNHMFVFVNSLINNPEFDSQTKETLKSTQAQWGTKCELSEAFFNKVATKSGIIEQILLWNQGRSAAALKTTGGKKRGRLGISKLTEANNAATNKSDRCTLIVTEGDSAKGLALAGLSVVGRDNYGIFPLRGKVLNVRDAPMKQVLKNEELNMIKKAMGLQHDKDYSDVSSLRYGRIMIMTDQDHDGSHIKGLFINFIHHYWPSLLKIPGFLTEFVTPIVKATKGDRTLAFFTVPEYKAWSEQNGTRGWTIKYYKGLGTSEPAEMQEYFGDLPKHKKEFRYVGPQDDASIQLAFSKSNVDQRKEWLANFQPGTHLDQSLTKIPYNEFINKEFILFSLEDCERSIASMVDGFKPGQRKIMFACFKRNLKGEIKIAQLAGYVLEHCAYHHGETSLYSTMIGMAQNFVGSNNLNLMEPVGNFGSRDQGGKDAAAARYIFTTLSPLTRYIFHPDDDDVLEYLEDEGMRIQPSYYVPTVPMLLINGNAGIGTGWSSFVPNYNPNDIVDNIKRLLRNEDTVPMHPWYRGFNGSIEWNDKKRSYLVKGNWHRSGDDSIEITELPVGSWTQGYKDFLEAMILANEEKDKKVKAAETKKKKKKDDEDDDDGDEDEAPKKKGKKGAKADDNDEDAGYTGPLVNIKDFKEYHTTTRVHFVIYSPDFKDMSDDAIEKKLKLTSWISINNMHLFDSEGRIKKYPTPEDILKDFFILRMKFYQMRKDFIVDRIGRELKILDNKMRFIRAVINKELVVSNRKKAELFAELRAKGYDPIPKDALKKKVTNEDVELLPQGLEKDDDDDEVDVRKKKDDDEEDPGARDYDYLLSMAIWSLTAERVKKLMEQVAEKQKELAAMQAVHPADLWERDLDAFLDAWNRFETNMKILDEAGVGGSAFRKPSVQQNAAASGSAEARKKKEANLQAFKKLQKLLPVKAAQGPPVPMPNRPEIITPIVKTDPIVPPPKIKKEDPSIKMEGIESSPAPKKTGIMQFFKKEEKPVVNKEEKPIVKKELTEAEISALPLSERLALRRNAPATASKKIDLGDSIDFSDLDEPAIPASEAKRNSSKMDIDESLEDFKPVGKKPKLASSAKPTTESKPVKKTSKAPSKVIDSSDDDIVLSDSSPPEKRTAKRLASAKPSSKFKLDDSESDSFIVSDSEESFAMSDSEEKPKVSKPKMSSATKKTSSTATAKKSTTVSSEEKPKVAKRTAKATATSKKKKVDSDSEISLEISSDGGAGSDSEDIVPVSRPKRARAVVPKFADDSSSIEGLDDSF